jgi:hypothetical protein
MSKLDNLIDYPPHENNSLGVATDFLFPLLQFTSCRPILLRSNQ